MENSCANVDQFAFWDDIHPTTAAHQVIGQLAQDSLLAATAKVNEPRSLLILLAGLALMRRRNDAL